ncbi:MAG: hypothetical protein K2K70_04945 [Lachnospiraceae bacterium]|nr:hypothetical protein [Lachnospiraceae bacterium]
MEENRLKIIKFIDSDYRLEGTAEQDNALYCEIQYKRDKSSFAGMVFRITNNRDVVTVEDCEERLIRNINNYESLYKGCIQEYINAVKNTFSLERKEYGIEILFLVYSDVRSSQIIFEELIKNIDKNIGTIKSQY